jgi:hypothetical protein
VWRLTKLAVLLSFFSDVKGYLEALKPNLECVLGIIWQRVYRHIWRLTANGGSNSLGKRMNRPASQAYFEYMEILIS